MRNIYLNYTICIIVLLLFICTIFVNCNNSIVTKTANYQSKIIPMSVNECDSIIVTEYFKDTLMIITDIKLKKELFDVLNYPKYNEIVKMPINLLLIFKGQNMDVTLGVCNNHLKNENGTYKCTINVEDRLRVLVKQNN
ncbi:MAG: hypothetical protein IKW83_06495 [Muribaculaceae bacterium]|nr:hypothetical protein [Muribaculaceae bacterium]